MSSAVALVSGGKDSLFALHAAKEVFGLDICVLAHIRPRDTQQEADSFMYQSVGSTMVDYIAEALELPLMIREMQGKPIATVSQEYVKTDGDEVEDLYELLNAVKVKFPLVSFVVSGAILSNYQKLRVENVCSRLNMISVAPLWNFDQTALIDLITSIPRYDVRIIKIATMGLERKHLGKSFRDLAPHLKQLSRRWGIHCCGEGGEFETICLETPLFVKKKVLVRHWTVYTHDSNPFAPVLYLHPTSGRDVSIDPTKTDREPQVDAFDRVKSCEYYIRDITGMDLLKDFENEVFAYAKHCSGSLTDFETFKRIFLSDDQGRSLQQSTASMSLWRSIEPERGWINDKVVTLGPYIGLPPHRIKLTGQESIFERMAIGFREIRNRGHDAGYAMSDLSSVGIIVPGASLGAKMIESALRLLVRQNCCSKVDWKKRESNLWFSNSKGDGVFHGDCEREHKYYIVDYGSCLQLFGSFKTDASVGEK